MNIKNELLAMEERMLDGELLQRCISAYQEEMLQAQFGAEEGAYRRAAASLSTVLNQEQKELLSQMEALYGENARYALHFCFDQGLYVGFQQFFVEKTTDRPFNDYIEEELLSDPNMRRHVDYSMRRDQILDIANAIELQLDQRAREDLVSIQYAWETRTFGVARYAYYLGCRYAMLVLERVLPVSMPARVVEKMLLVEYELGFTRTWAERERDEDIKNRPIP